ncbi:hypothetical protein HQO26_16960 [Rhodococcus fascians]|nr:hypothetical protein [Rhodococcus fascians]MBY4418746.1 hypothetical protein [Rhodococcus fascians]
MSITMQRCTTCENAVFPPRSVCPHCHSSVFEPATAHRGLIEETALQRGTPVVMYATIRTDLGPTVVGKVIGDGAVPGADVELTSSDTQRTDGLIAVIPQPTAKE